MFAEGTDAVVECPAFFGVDTSARMLWFHNLVTIRSGRCFSPENGRLTIHNIRMKDSDGNYQCSIFHNHGIVATKTIQIEVLPQSKFAPKIDDTNRRIEVAYGQPLNLPCRLKQQGESVTYSWTIDTEFEHDVLVNTTADLHIEAHKFVGGIYTCKAENEFGYDIADFSVKIIGKQNITL